MAGIRQACVHDLGETRSATLVIDQHWSEIKIVLPGGECSVIGAVVAERVGRCENPLADGYFGQHAIDECAAVSARSPPQEGQKE